MPHIWRLFARRARQRDVLCGTHAAILPPFRCRRLLGRLPYRFAICHATRMLARYEMSASFKPESAAAMRDHAIFMLSALPP